MIPQESLNMDSYLLEKIVALWPSILGGYDFEPMRSRQPNPWEGL